MAIFVARGTPPTEPIPAVAAPTVTRVAEPSPTASATSLALLITGCQASPAAFSSLPSTTIAPANRIAAAETSATMATPTARFLARLVRFGDKLDVALLTPCVASETVFTDCTDSVASLTDFSFEKAPSAVAMPPKTSSAPMTRVALSTPLQSPFLIASQLSAIS